MAVLLRSINTLQQRSIDLATTTEGISHQEYSDQWQSHYQQTSFTAQSTLSRYNGNNNGDDTSKLNSFETRKHPVTDLEHQYDKDHEVFNRFPLVFLGILTVDRWIIGTLETFQWLEETMLTNIHSSEIYVYISLAQNVRI